MAKLPKYRLQPILEEKVRLRDEAVRFLNKKKEELAMEEARLKQLEEARRADLQNLAAQIAQRSITIEANANAEGHLYGSVNADQIAAALRSDNVPIEDENVRIEGPLKELGLYTIKLSLGQDVDTEVKLWVVPTHTEEVPA